MSNIAPIVAIASFIALFVFVFSPAVEDTRLPVDIHLEEAEEPMRPYTNYVKSYRVIDGDTVRCVLDLGYNVFHEVDVRLIGIDAPEIRGDEKTAGIPVKIVLEDYLDAFSTLTVQSKKWDKYGRAVGDIFGNTGDALTASQYLLQRGLVVGYGRGQQLTKDKLADIRKKAHDQMLPFFDLFIEPFAKSGVYDLAGTVDPNLTCVQFGVVFGYLTPEYHMTEETIQRFVK